MPCPSTFNYLHKIFRLCSVLTTMALLLSLNACVQTPVHVVRPDDFSRMAMRIDDTLRQHQVLDANGAYIVASKKKDIQSLLRQNTDINLLEIPRNIGHTLFTQISPWYFTTPPTNKDSRRFSDIIMHPDDVRYTETGFTAIYNRHIISMNLTAITDWDSDKSQDWLLSSYIQPIPNPDKERYEYYILITNPRTIKPLQSHILGAFLYQNGQCTPLSATAAAFMNTQPGLGTIIEAEPGDNILLPANAPIPQHDSPFHEQGLSE